MGLRSSVSPTLIEIGTWALSYVSEAVTSFFFVLQWYDSVVEDSARIGYCLLFWDSFPRFLDFALPFLNVAEAKLSQFCFALHYCKIVSFSCLTVAGKFVQIVWKTPWTAVPMKAVISKHGLCARYITVKRPTVDPSHSTVPTWSVIDVYA